MPRGNGKTPKAPAQAPDTAVQETETVASYEATPPTPTKAKRQRAAKAPSESSEAAQELKTLKQQLKALDKELAAQSKALDKLDTAAQKREVQIEQLKDLAVKARESSANGLKAAKQAGYEQGYRDAEKSTKADIIRFIKGL